MVLLSPIGGRRMLTREVLAAVTYSLGRFVRAVRTGFSVQVFEMVSAEDVLERARVPEPAWCDAEAHVLGEERGGGVDRQRGDVLAVPVQPRRPRLRRMELGKPPGFLSVH